MLQSYYYGNLEGDYFSRDQHAEADRLTTRLESASGPDVLFIYSPAGSGKSTLSDCMIHKLKQTPELKAVTTSLTWKTVEALGATGCLKAIEAQLKQEEIEDVFIAVHDFEHVLNSPWHCEQIACLFQHALRQKERRRARAQRPSWKFIITARYPDSEEDDSGEETSDLDLAALYQSLYLHGAGRKRSEHESVVSHYSIVFDKLGVRAFEEGVSPDKLAIEFHDVKETLVKKAAREIISYHLHSPGKANALLATSLEVAEVFDFFPLGLALLRDLFAIDPTLYEEHKKLLEEFKSYRKQATEQTKADFCCDCYNLLFRSLSERHQSILMMVLAEVAVCTTDRYFELDLNEDDRRKLEPFLIRVEGEDKPLYRLAHPTVLGLYRTLASAAKAQATETEQANNLERRERLTEAHLELSREIAESQDPADRLRWIRHIVRSPHLDRHTIAKAGKAQERMAAILLELDDIQDGHSEKYALDLYRARVDVDACFGLLEKARSIRNVNPPNPMEQLRDVAPDPKLSSFYATWNVFRLTQLAYEHLDRFKDMRDVVGCIYDHRAVGREPVKSADDWFWQSCTHMIEGTTDFENYEFEAAERRWEQSLETKKPIQKISSLENLQKYLVSAAMFEQGKGLPTSHTSMWDDIEWEETRDKCTRLLSLSIQVLDATQRGDDPKLKGLKKSFREYSSLKTVDYSREAAYCKAAMLWSDLHRFQKDQSTQDLLNLKDGLQTLKLLLGEVSDSWLDYHTQLQALWLGLFEIQRIPELADPAVAKSRLEPRETDVAKFFAYFPYESCFFDLLAFKWQLSRVLNEPPQKRARTVEGLGQMLQNSDDCLSWSQRRFVGVHHDDLAKELRTVLEAKGFPSKPILVRLEGQLASYQADIAPEDRINPGYVPCLTAPSLLRFFPRDYYQMREILLAPGAEGAS